MRREVGAEHFSRARSHRNVQTLRFFAQCDGAVIQGRRRGEQMMRSEESN